MLTDRRELTSLRDTWGSLRSLEAGLLAGLPAARFGLSDETDPSVIAASLLLLAATDVLTRTLRALRKQGVFSEPSEELLDLLAAARPVLPFRDFAAIEAIGWRVCGIRQAGTGEHVNACREDMATISVQLQDWNILESDVAAEDFVRTRPAYVERWADDATDRVLGFLDCGDEATIRAVLSSLPEAEDVPTRETLLCLAAERFMVSAMRVLLELGSDTEFRGEVGLTPLLLLAEELYGDDDDAIEVARMLIDAGADMEAVDALGETPFLKAAKRGSYALTTLLAERGCNVHAVSNDSGYLYDAVALPKLRKDRNFVDHVRRLVADH